MFAGATLLLMLHPLGAGIVAEPDVVSGPFYLEAVQIYFAGPETDAVQVVPA